MKMKSKKIIPLVIVFIFSNAVLAFAQVATIVTINGNSHYIESNKIPKPVKKEKIGFMKTIEGDTIDILESAYIGKNEVQIKNGEAKSKVYKHKKVSWMKVGDRIFISIAENKKSNDRKLMELLAQNDKYKLFQWWYDWYYYYIFDNDMNIVGDEIKVTDRGITMGSEKNNKKAIEALKQYFSDCKPLMDSLQNNFDNNKILSSGIINISCNGAPDGNLLLK